VQELGLIAGLPRVEFEQPLRHCLQQVVDESVVLRLLVLVHETVV
jgi:hypothetical protein